MSEIGGGRCRSYGALVLGRAGGYKDVAPTALDAVSLIFWVRSKIFVTWVNLSALSNRHSFISKYL